MRKLFKKLIVRLKLIILFLCILFFGYLVWFLWPYWSFAQNNKIVKSLLYPTEAIIKLQNDSVNIVFLGIPGGKHDGALLTDSIILVNFNLFEKKLNLISVPRDIWSTDLKDKINSAFFYGWQNNQNALYWLKRELKKITGYTPSYYLVINFNKFKQLIDYLGGVDIYVQNSFIDKQFPVVGKENNNCDGDLTLACRYQTVRFNQGWQHMNGDLALKFARSRNSLGKEGTDFSRDKRQQKLLEAVFRKITEPIFILRRKKFIDFIKLTDKSFQKNITLAQLTALARTYFLNKKQIKTNNIVIDNKLFFVPDFKDYQGRYVLLPKKGFMSLRKYIQQQTKGEN